MNSSLRLVFIAVGFRSMISGDLWLIYACFFSQKHDLRLKMSDNLRLKMGDDLPLIVEDGDLVLRNEGIVICVVIYSTGARRRRGGGHRKRPM